MSSNSAASGAWSSDPTWVTPDRTSTSRGRTSSSAVDAKGVNADGEGTMDDGPIRHGVAHTVSQQRQVVLSDRAKARLRRARLLLQSDPVRFGLAAGWKLVDAGGVYEAIQAAVASLAEPAREQLRGLVDWVEEYEAVESAPK